MLVQEALTGSYQVHGEAAEAGIVTALSFGARGNEPGSVNETLAVLAINLAEAHGTRVVAQREIADAMIAKGARNYLARRAVPETPAEQEYFDTGHVLAQASKVAAGGGHILVAQAYHMPRVDAMAQKRAMSTVATLGMPKTWDPESDQWWTRSRRLWTLREPLVIAHHKKTGRI